MCGRRAGDGLIVDQRYIEPPLYNLYLWVMVCTAITHLFKNMGRLTLSI